MSNQPNTTQAARAATGTVTCPIGTEQQNGTEHTIIGCGSTDVSGPDDDGLYDCDNCGIWFDLTQEPANSA